MSITYGIVRSLARDYIAKISKRQDHLLQFVSRRLGTFRHENWTFGPAYKTVVADDLPYYQSTWFSGLAWIMTAQAGVWHRPVSYVDNLFNLFGVAALCSFSLRHFGYFLVLVSHCPPPTPPHVSVNA